MLKYLLGIGLSYMLWSGFYGEQQQQQRPQVAPAARLGADLPRFSMKINRSGDPRYGGIIL